MTFWDIFRHLVGNLSHSSSVLSSAAALDEKFVSTYCLATSKGCFLVFFRIWRNTAIVRTISCNLQG